MRNTRNWKHTTRNRKQYGKRNTSRYATPFMELDEAMIEEWEREMQYGDTDDGVEEE